MLNNYLKSGWRNVTRNKAFSMLNILGLALGLACSLLILLWVNDELAIDRFHENNDRLYSIFERQYHDGRIDGGFYTPGLLPHELKATMPEVEFATGMAWNELNTFEANGKILKKDGNYAGEDFFRMFSYPLVQGEVENALKSPLDIAISRSMAEDFFGSPEAAYGQSIRYENRKDLKITAVFEDLSRQSSFQFDYLINWETFFENNSWAKDWGNNGPYTFFALREGTDPHAFEDKIRDFLDLYRQNENKNFVIKLGMLPYGDQYLHGKLENGEIVGGRIAYVKLFGLVAVFILLIACINFMNLTTARSTKRSREIGVRKVVGAVRSALIGQFIAEACLIAVIALAIALALVALVMPAFNGITQKQIGLPVSEPFFWISMFVLTAVTGFVSGSYPALYLSSLNPIRAFKGSLRLTGQAVGLRKGLVVLQFTLSIMLIVGTLTVSRQVDYLQSVSLGYDREHLIYIPLEGDLTGKYTLFKDRALEVPGISAVSRVSQNPTSIQNGTGGVVWEGKDPNSMLQFVQAAIGYEFMKTMKIEMADGREFLKDFAFDSTAYIVNETAVKIFGYKDPVGMPLTFWQKPGTIVGVVKDFHFTSLHNEIKPLVLRLGEELGWGWAVVRTQPGKTREALVSLEKLCRELNPQFPFTYKFSDEEYRRMYVSEQVISKLSNVFAFLAIFISCLGLLGLAMFTVEQRIKEIGIRKVLGASAASLFHLLSGELILLVIIALLVASPLAWIAMERWLSDYAYRIEIGWWVFVAAGALAIAIAVATVSFQTIRALLVNPVSTLRAE